MLILAQSALLKIYLYLFVLPWKRHMCQLNYQETEVCVVNLTNKAILEYNLSALSANS